MQVNSYIFQSPYSSQVQVGRLDTSTNTESTEDKDNSKQVKVAPPNTTQALQENESKLKVAKAIENSSTLDLYA